ncbi:MAG: cytochrome c peroxidase [Gemmatimonadaceae bacterium]
MAAPRVALTIVACALPALMIAASGVQAQAHGGRQLPPTGLDLYIPAPVGTPSREAIALGRLLFFDPVLSRDSTVACVTCHHPARAFTDGKRLAEGVQGRPGKRNSPTVLNRGYGTSFSWDGRTNLLESQVLRAIQDPVEMDLALDSAVQRLARHRVYAVAFQALRKQQPSADAIAGVLADYVRSIRGGDSPFDRFSAGDESALTPLARRGLALFQGRARCDRCHSGSLLSDEQFHNTGVAWRNGVLLDAGRNLVSGRTEDRGAFKTPTLREIASTAPYMHDGSLATLEEVVDFYDRGGTPNPHLDHRIRPLRLTADEKAALLEFLRALSGKVREGW